jgi:hypothetical protein
MTELNQVWVPLLKCGLYWLSFWGFGHLGADLITPRNETQRNWPYATMGLACFILLGGILTALHWVSLELLTLLLFIGVLRAGWAIRGGHMPFSFLVGHESPQAGKYHPVGVVLGIAAGCFLLFELSLTYQPFFNVHDDYQSYLVSIQKLLHQGWFGFDPFNLRLLVSALGGHSFFAGYAFVLGNEEILYVYEFTIGWLCLLEVMNCHSSLTKTRRCFYWVAIAATIFLIQSIVNTTSTYTMTPLLYVFLLISRHGDELGLSSTQKSILKSLFVGVIICLKTTYVPSIGLLILIDLLQNPVGKSTNIKHLLQWAAGSVFVIFFWAYAHLEATGSAFFPFLGKGYLCRDFPTFLIDGPGTFGVKFVEIITMIFTYPLLQLTTVMGCLIIFSGYSKNRKVVVGLTLAPLFASFVVLSKTGVYDFGASNHLLRYLGPLSQAILLFFILSEIAPAYENWIKGAHQRTIWFFSVCLLIPMINNTIQRITVTERYWQMKKERTLNNALHSPTLALPDLRQAQASVPEGATIYARLSRANLLDFSRNRIFVADLPNQMNQVKCLDDQSIPTDAFASHFLENDVRYLLYNYKNEGGYPRSVFGGSANHPWEFYSYGAKQSFAFADQMAFMMRDYHQLFNNGAHVVLDLQAPVPPPIPPPAP